MIKEFACVLPCTCIGYHIPSIFHFVNTIALVVVKLNLCQIEFFATTINAIIF